MSRLISFIKPIIDQAIKSEVLQAAALIPARIAAVRRAANELRQIT